MNAIISLFGTCFIHIVNLLNRRFFPDMPITYLQLILGCIIIKFIFSFIFGGFKETQSDINNFSHSAVRYTNNKTKERERKKETIRQRVNKSRR